MSVGFEFLCNVLIDCFHSGVAAAATDVVHLVAQGGVLHGVPGGVHLEVLRRADLEAPRRADLEAPRRADLEAPRRVGLEAPRRVGLEVPRKAGLAVQGVPREVLRRGVDLAVQGVPLKAQGRVGQRVLPEASHPALEEVSHRPQSRTDLRVHL